MLKITLLATDAVTSKYVYPKSVRKENNQTIVDVVVLDRLCSVIFDESMRQPMSDNM